MTGYTIDDVAARTGVGKHALRYYEREGLLRTIAKAANGHRRYSDDDLGWVRMLTLLRATGMPIREMKQFVALTHRGDETIPERVEVLARYRDALIARMSADREHLDRLNNKLDIYHGVLAAQVAVPQDLTEAANSST